MSDVKKVFEGRDTETIREDGIRFRAGSAAALDDRLTMFCSTDEGRGLGFFDIDAKPVHLLAIMASSDRQGMHLSLTVNARETLLLNRFQAGQLASVLGHFADCSDLKDPNSGFAFALEASQHALRESHAMREADRAAQGAKASE